LNHFLVRRCGDRLDSDISVHAIVGLAVMGLAVAKDEPSGTLLLHCNKPDHDVIAL
jgi:hypothetical protein